MSVHLSTLSDADLTSEMRRLAAAEREATAALLVHLAEFDARRLHEGAGYSSLFKYCTHVLGFSEDAAYNRIEAARAARRYPALVEMLGRGALNLTTARLLARQLTPENHQRLLASAAGKGKDEVEELLARLFPRPDVPARVRKVPIRGVPPPTPPGPQAGLSLSDGGAPPPSHTGEPAPVAALSPPKPAVVRPLAAARYEVRFTATAQTRDKLRRAQDLLAHAVPSGDIAEVVDRALTVLIAELEGRKFAAVKRPRPRRTAPLRDDTVPADVRRAVAARDDGSCAFAANDGHRCGERRFVEFHHVVPRARGGPATVENIQLRCRAHNGHEVDLFFGPGMRYTREASRGRHGWVGSDSDARGRSGTSP
jgi:hypothetical protein